MGKEEGWDQKEEQMRNQDREIERDLGDGSFKSHVTLF